MHKRIVFVTEKATSRTTLAYARAHDFVDHEDPIYRVTTPRFPISYQPTEASLYLTPACNLSCSYCYIVPFYKGADLKLLTTDEWKSVMEDLHSNGVRVLKLIGGEALLRDDLAELLRHAEAIGFSGVELTTNATYPVLHRNQEALMAFKALTIHKVISTSLDAADAEVNDRLRGAHSAVVKGIKYLQGLELPLSVASVVTKLNYTQLDAMAKFAYELGVTAYQFNNLVPIFPGQRELIISDPRLKREVAERITEITKAYLGRMSIVNRFVPAPNIKPDLFNRHAKNPVIAGSSLSGCPAGTREVYVLPDGKLIACPMFIQFKKMYSESSIVGGRFAEVWKEDTAINEFRGYLVGPKLHGTCATCESGPACKGGCRAMTFFMENTLEAKDPRCLF